MELKTGGATAPLRVASLRCCQCEDVKDGVCLEFVGEGAWVIAYESLEQLYLLATLERRRDRYANPVQVKYHGLVTVGQCIELESQGTDLRAAIELWEEVRRLQEVVNLLEADLAQRRSFLGSVSQPALPAPDSHLDAEVEDCLSGGGGEVDP